MLLTDTRHSSGEVGESSTAVINRSPSVNECGCRHICGGIEIQFEYKSSSRQQTFVEERNKLINSREIYIFYKIKINVQSKHVNTGFWDHKFSIFL